MVLGENIGTTISANIAAAVGNPNARRAALAHTFFNVFGVVWALILFRPFLSFIGVIITWLGYPNPTLIDYAAGIEAGSAESTAALYGVSMLHTLFNTFNTCLLIWFIPLIVRFVTWAIKDKPEDEEQTARLQFINAGPIGTAELALTEAKNEICHFAQICHNGLDYIRSAVHATDEDKFEFYRKKLVKYEEIADRIEYEIATFLNALPEENISEDARQQVKAMYKIIGELESLGDAGESISRILSRRNIHNKKFTDKQVEKVDTMLSLVSKAYEVMISNLQSNENGQAELRRAVDCEIEINDMRNTLREEEILRLEQNDSEYHSSVYYLDIISEIERFSFGEGKVRINQPDKLIDLMGSMANVDGEVKQVEGYRVLVYSGNNSRQARDEANAMAEYMRKNYPGAEVYVVFEAPIRTCEYGDFRTREEAELLMYRLRATKKFKEISVKKCLINLPY
jgi:phosphate:Na+ symporter